MIVRFLLRSTITFSKNNSKSILQHFNTNQLFNKLITQQTALPKALELLSSLNNNSKLNSYEFTNIWKRYAYYVEKVYESLETSDSDSKSTRKDRLMAIDHNQLHTLFVTLLQIHQKFNKFTSQNTTKIYNRLSDALFQNWDKLTIDEKISVLLSISFYNKKKASAYMLKNEDQILRSLPQALPSSVVTVFRLLHELELRMPTIFETGLDRLYLCMDKLSSRELERMAYYLASSYNFVNRSFFLALVTRYFATFQFKGHLSPSRMLNFMSAMSAIEKNLRNSAYYLFQLDSHFQKGIEYVFNHIEELPQNQLKSFIETIRRCCYYCPTIINKLCGMLMKAEVREFKILEDSRSKERYSHKNTGNMVSLDHLWSMLHLLATFSFSHPQFLNYSLKTLQLTLQLPEKELIKPAYIPRIIWALCVLLRPHEIAEVVKKLIERAPPNFSDFLGDFRIIYYSYLYLRLYSIKNVKTIFPDKYLSQIMEKSKSITNSSYVSKTHHDIYKVLVGQLGVPCIQEYNLSNIMCDICIPRLTLPPKEGDSMNSPRILNNILVDIHGFQHFSRGKEVKLRGSTILKSKVVRMLGYSLYYIPIDQWEVSQDKTKYLRDFLQLVYQKQMERISQSQQVNQKD